MSQDEPPRRGRRRPAHASSAVIGVLTLLLGFAIAVQVRANSGTDALSSLREDDLVGILDDQDDRADRLRAQIGQLQNSLRTLRDSGNQAAAARAQERQEAQSLGILLGTLAAHGPGVVVTVTDAQHALGGEDLLDLVEELRGAGAEAIEFGGVRISTDSSFEGSGANVQIDGATVSAPYRVIAIGEPKTLDTALEIPGGVAATFRAKGGDLTVAESRRVSVSATRALPELEGVTPSK